MNVPEDILKAALIKFPPCMVLKVSFPPNGLDKNGKDRANYIEGRMDERFPISTFSVSFASGKSWEDFITISIKATDEVDAIEKILAENPEYLGWHYIIN